MRAQYVAAVKRWGVPADRREDMIGYADALREDALVADFEVSDRVLLPVPGRQLEVIHTAGHTPGHICIRDQAAATIFTGDHVLPDMYPGVGIGGPSTSNAIVDYLASLTRVAAFDDHAVHPGHQRPFRGLSSRVAELTAHHLRRAAEVRAVLDSRPRGSAWDVASQLTWSAGWANLRAFALHSALIQTELHIARLTAL